MERARSALAAIDPACSRDEWVRVAMAAKAADMTFEDFHEWSKGANNYQNEQDCKAVWRSITSDGGVTEATLFSMAMQAGWTVSMNGHSRPIVRPAGDDAPSIWNQCQDATPENGYIKRKLGLHFGLKVYRGPMKIAGESIDGYLAVPALDLDGNIKTIQFVPSDTGKKLNLPGKPVAGFYVVGGAIEPAGTTYLCEGIGQAWSAHQASGKPAVCCFGFGRIMAVAKDIKQRHPEAWLVIVSDVGKENQCASIARDLRCDWVELPQDLGPNGDINDLHKRDGLKAVKAILEAVKQIPQRYKLWTPEEVITRQASPYRIKGIAAQSGIGCIGGMSTAGKSFVALDLAGAILEGREWFGHRTRQCPVTYIVQEGQSGFPKRLKAYTERQGSLNGLRMISAPFSLMSNQDEVDLIEAIKAVGHAHGVVIIDTLAQVAAGMDENSSQDMGNAIAAIKRIQAAIGGLIILVHHIGKDSAKGLRGHSSLFAALDFVIEVSRDCDRREWRIAKAKDGDDMTAHSFRLETVEIDTDEDGDLITSCVVVSEQSGSEYVKRVSIPQGGNQRIAWDVLGELLNRSKSFGMGDATPSRPCITLADSVAAIRLRLPCDNKHRTERAQQAITGLVNRGCIALKEDWIWAV